MSPCRRSTNNISLIGHTRPGESRRRTWENRPRIAQVDSAAQPQLSPDPVQLADDLVADEQALRDPSIPEAALAAAARRQQAAYRAIGRHREWDTITRARIPPSLLETYDRNVDARRQLAALAQVKDTVPPWRIVPPAPADELLGCYRDAEQASEGAAPTATWRSMRGGDSE